MSSFPLSEIPTFQAFRHNTSIRDTIYADRGLDGVAEFLVQQHIIQTYNDDPNAIHKPLLIQLAKHHNREAIAKAVSQAWLVYEIVVRVWNPPPSATPFAKVGVIG